MCSMRIFYPMTRSDPTTLEPSEIRQPTAILERASVSLLSLSLFSLSCCTSSLSKGTSPCMVHVSGLLALSVVVFLGRGGAGGGEWGGRGVFEIPVGTHAHSLLRFGTTILGQVRFPQLALMSLRGSHSNLTNRENRADSLNTVGVVCVTHISVSRCGVTVKDAKLASVQTSVGSILVWYCCLF